MKTVNYENNNVAVIEDYSLITNSDGNIKYNIKEIYVSSAIDNSFSLYDDDGNTIIPTTFIKARVPVKLTFDINTVAGKSVLLSCGLVFSIQVSYIETGD